MFNSTKSCTFDLNSNDLNLRKKKLIIKIKNLIFEILCSLFNATKQRIKALKSTSRMEISKKLILKYYKDWKRIEIQREKERRVTTLRAHFSSSWY